MPIQKPTLQDVMNSIQDVKIFLEDNVMTALRDHDRRFDELEERMSRLEDRIEGLENRMGDLEEKMGDLDGRMGSLENGVLDYKDWTVKHVTSLEEEVSMIVVRLDEVREKLKNHNPQQYPELKQEVAQLEIRVVRLEEQANKK